MIWLSGFFVLDNLSSQQSDSKDVLDEATTMKLLESYGRADELVFFASLKGLYEIVAHHYIQQGEAKKALDVLCKPGVSIDLQYKFAPDLMMLDETVESWMTTKNLNPRKLIPAMMRYSSEPHARNETHEVIKYLEYRVRDLGNEDPGIHNLLLSLYAKQEDDSSLLRFLQCKFGKKRENAPEFFYDPKYALRLCLKEECMRACVHIYSMMSMHEEAVALALQEAICSSLEDYNRHIELLKEEMNDATRGADNIRGDITALAQRYAVIERGEECGVSRRKILNVGGQYGATRSYASVGSIAPFYVFPCGYARLRSQLDDAIAGECPFCGELMIRETSLPFILPIEEQEVNLWLVKPPPPFCVELFCSCVQGVLSCPILPQASSNFVRHVCVKCLVIDCD